MRAIRWRQVSRSLFLFWIFLWLMGVWNWLQSSLDNLPQRGHSSPIRWTPFPAGSRLAGL